MVASGRRAGDNLTLPLIPRDSPWWIQVALIVLFWLGPTALVALFFMLVFAGTISSPLTENNQILKRVESKLDAATTRMAAEVESSRRHDEHVIRLLLATCRNVARDDQGRMQCDNYWRR